MAKTMRAGPSWPTADGAILSLRSLGDQFGAKCSSAFTAAAPEATEPCALDTILVRPDGARVLFIRRPDGARIALELCRSDAQLVGAALYDESMPLN